MIDDISNLLGSREPVNALLGSRRKPQLEVFTVEFGDDAVDVAYYGATVTSWRTAGRERLWMSSLSRLDESGPIRGGVPVAFPQFADQGPLPLHGFARTLRWTRVGGESRDDCATATFALRTGRGASRPDPEAAPHAQMHAFAAAKLEALYAKEAPKGLAELAARVLKKMDTGGA